MKTIRNILVLLTSLASASLSAQTNNNTMNNKQYSVEVIRYNIPPVQGAEFEKAYAEAGKHLQASKHCLGYRLIHGVEEPQHYIVIIHWTSKEEHLQGFRKSPEFMPFFNLVKPFYNNIEEMKHYNQTATEWVR